MRDHIIEGEWKSTESDHKCDVHFTNWRPGEPNNDGGDEDCVIINSSSGEWLDIPCSLEYHFVCQYLE